MKNKGYLKIGAVTLLILVSLIWKGGAVYAAQQPIRFKSNEKIIMYASQKKGLKVRVKRAYKDYKIQFRSSDKEIVKVTKKGILKAKKKGKAKVYATLKGTSYRAKCKVKVLQNTEQLEIQQSSEPYYIGQQYDMKYKAVPANTKEGIKWKSSDKKIAQITKQGILKVKAAGQVQITATSDQTNTTDTITIQCSKVPPIYFEEGKAISIPSGTGYQLKLKNVIGKKISYRTSWARIGSVSNTGYITANRPGKIYVTATAGAEKAVLELSITADKGFVTKEILDNLNLADRTKLMVVAHPDDESLWGGAHLKEGNWFIVCLTNEYTAKRKEEFNEMLKVSGAKGMMLSYTDVNIDANGKWVRDNWETCKKGINEDLTRIINYKNWNEIACHSPEGETRHIHHQNTSKAVTEVCKRYNQLDKLWYFGPFYSRYETAPADVGQITDQEMLFKQSLLNMYPSQMHSILAYWQQSVRYENWVKATEYK